MSFHAPIQWRCERSYKKRGKRGTLSIKSLLPNWANGKLGKEKYTGDLVVNLLRSVK